MNFLTQQQEVAALLGLDETQTEQGTLIKRWLNISQRDISDAAEWPWVQSVNPEIIQTEVDITTGTATTTAASTTVTLSDSPTSSVTGRFIKFDSSDENWYRVTDHTGGSPTLTISPGSLLDQTASSYTLRKFFYQVSSAVDRITRLRTGRFPYELVGKPFMWLNPFSQAADQTGNLRVYAVRGRTSSTTGWSLVVWPFPDTSENLYVEHLFPVSDLVDDDDVSIMPEKWHTTAMLQGAIWRGYIFLDDTRATRTKTVFDDYIQQMKDDMLVNLDEERELKPVDGQVLLREPLLPGTYPLR